ncbi:16S rRNA (guanine(966)-N(2))-methyltransferase RsmD [Salicibibacter kimchii]|uniref:16S rRNA (Guanine(966)-N(2))-methyltransferase RsmD n=1 Tax=Salicibibacter kimchii TaxID=2099786 RepID=A0A345BX08_9BACI|nr:16S rRNA (guanine(966)-N(2))-methyltransferase RsmD [Salicibibacter kimchii]AXF55489.1 16S rRNA (guanine(966)-N(2))-methyltransferase RsmD [Salicibibacter kimchii]
MRIIAGSRKGTRLKAVPGAETRPTSDRLKEALFQMIGPYFQGGTGIDLYAGTGALGMEALSRGIDEMYFSDTSGAAIKVIRENASRCHFEKQVHIYKQGAVHMAKRLHRDKRRCSLIFLDPPYQQQQLEEDITLIQDLELVTPETVIVAEHSSSLHLEQEIGDFCKSRTKTFGDTQISIFTNNTERNEEGCQR